MAVEINSVSDLLTYLSNKEAERLAEIEKLERELNKGDGDEGAEDY